MRYLKVIAQDRFGSGRADYVFLEFHEQSGMDAESRLLNSVVALDFSADGKADFNIDDLTDDGKEYSLDQCLRRNFANTYLAFNWFNPGASRKQYLKLIAEDLQGDGTPNVVRLQLRREIKEGLDGTRIYWSAAFDRDNDGKIDFSFHGDANGDGRIDKVDDLLVRRLAALYLKFNWS